MSANDIIHGPPWTDRRARAARMLASGISMELVSLKLGLSLYCAAIPDALCKRWRRGTYGAWRRGPPPSACA